MEKRPHTNAHKHTPTTKTKTTVCVALPFRRRRLSSLCGCCWGATVAPTGAPRAPPFPLHQPSSSNNSKKKKMKTHKSMLVFQESVYRYIHICISLCFAFGCFLFCFFGFSFLRKFVPPFFICLFHCPFFLRCNVFLFWSLSLYHTPFSLLRSLVQVFQTCCVPSVFVFLLSVRVFPCTPHRSTKKWWSEYP